MSLPREFLEQRQNLPLQAKLALTQSRIRKWYEHWEGLVYISYSGGKDSTVLLDIVRGMYPDVPAVFCDTGLEYPEVRQLALKKSDVVIKPAMTFKRVIETYGYPFPSKEQAQYIYQYRTTKSEKLKNLRLNGANANGSFCISGKWRYLIDAPFMVSGKCCDVMKKAPFHKYEKDTRRKPIIATMASESKLREQQYLKHGCNAFDLTRPSSMPLGFWTDQDVLEYLKKTGIQYASCYGRIIETSKGLALTGVNRTGCMFCMFGINCEHEPNRFQRMESDYPKQYAYCMNKLGIKDVLKYVGIPYQRNPTLFDEMEGWKPL